MNGRNLRNYSHTPVCICIHDLHARPQSNQTRAGIEAKAHKLYYGCAALNLSVLLQKFDVATVTSVPAADPGGTAPAAASPEAASAARPGDITRASVLQFLFGPATRIDDVDRRGLLAAVFTALQASSLPDPEGQRVDEYETPDAGSDDGASSVPLCSTTHLVTRAETLFANTDMLLLVCAARAESSGPSTGAGTASSSNGSFANSLV
jgi:hypothetical protein